MAGSEQFTHNILARGYMKPKQAVAKAVEPRIVEQQESGQAVIVIPPIKMGRLEVEIVGDTPLLMNAFGKKIQEQMKKRYSDGVKEPRGKAAPPDEELYEAAMHYTEDGKPAYPGGGMKKAILVAARALDLDVNAMRQIKSGMYVVDALIVIKGEPRMRVDWGKNSGRNRSPRRIVRAEFPEWSARVRITYDSDIHKPEQIINIINRAGVYSGWGEWRPSSARPGTFGMFHVKIAG